MYSDLKILRLYTESIGDESASDEIMSQYFDGFTKYNATGYWQGAREKSVVYEVVYLSTSNKESILWDKLQRASEEIKQRNKQQSVLITCTTGIGRF